VGAQAAGKPCASPKEAQPFSNNVAGGDRVPMLDCPLTMERSGLATVARESLSVYRAHEWGGTFPFGNQLFSKNQALTAAGQACGCAAFFASAES
jgi:hypothetical protein